jgi:glyoxylase-like metal-dependent hydrolase (beta-lactamase superfamily II)
MRRVARIIGILLLVLVLFLAAGLGWAHVSLRRSEQPLPDLIRLPAPPAGADLPVSITYVNTASQPMPRSTVLDTGADPSPDAEYVMSHPSFVLRWADGRLLLIDAGMTREGAIEFGQPLEMVAGAEPITAHASVAATLGDAAGDVRGIVFTHLHVDHVGGLTELCARRRQPLPVFMSPNQATYGNYTTRPGRALIEEASCARVSTLPQEGVAGLPGLAGVFLFAAGGHTPGTQVILAWVATSGEPRLYAFVGDVVNNIDAINHNISKPFLYRLLVVPENDARLAELRTLLRRLRDERGATILVSHDELSIEAAGLHPYGAAS